MKKQIAILGSTGSIGKNTFDILLKDKESFEIFLLTSNGNINEMIKHTKKFKLKNIIISNKQK